MASFDENSVKIFDRKIRLFNWPKANSGASLALLQDDSNFNAQNYGLAMGLYLYWLETIYPRLKEDQEENHIYMAQSAYNIIHMYAPHHHLHLALNQF